MSEVVGATAGSHILFIYIIVGENYIQASLS